jgi:hypothetical protein
MPPYIITILGYYGHNNAGDEAFKLAFSQAFGGRAHQYVTNFGNEPRIPVAAFGGGALLNDYFIKLLKPVERVHAIGCSFPYGQAISTSLTG